jgi:hydroxymethylpyrimidine/phosphomethylpyrimidine kinase
VSEALSFLDQALDAGFRPGMGQIVPDRFFWALPPEGELPPAEGEAPTLDDSTTPPTNPRHVH